MAVEALHLNLFPSRILNNREMTMNCVENGNMFTQPIGYGGVMTQPMLTPATNNLVPMKSDTGLAIAASRKRSRDAMAMINPVALTNFQTPIPIANNSLSFLGEDLSFQIQQQQLEIDRFISQHNEKVRVEVEERRKRHCQRIAAAMEDSIMNRLKAKEAEIDKIGKLNWALEERVKSLCVENQFWREMAQNNEATANALRASLEQVLAQVQNGADEESSCCGSSGEETGGARRCKKCGKEEACVLILPCRHLCLCTVCGSTLHTCPVCNAVKTASVNVNFSA